MHLTFRRAPSWALLTVIVTVVLVPPLSSARHLDDAAWEAKDRAWDAAWDAEDAAWDAKRGAWDAVWDAEDAAWDAKHAAWDAAWDAEDAAWDAAWRAKDDAWAAKHATSEAAWRAYWHTYWTAWFTTWDAYWETFWTGWAVYFDAWWTAWDTTWDANALVWSANRDRPTVWEIRDAAEAEVAEVLATKAPGVPAPSTSGAIQPGMMLGDLSVKPPPPDASVGSVETPAVRERAPESVEVKLVVPESEDVTVDEVVRVAWRTVPRLSLADLLPLAPSAPAGAAAAAPWEGGLAVAPSQDGFASAASVHGGPGADPPRIAWGSGTAAQTETSWARFVATRAAPAGPGAIRWDPSPLVTAALATLFAIPAWALLRKLAREHVLAVPMRRDVLRAVQTQPGVNIREIAAALDVHYTTAQHHVRVLVEADFITVERIRGQLRCFANGGVFTSRERAIAAFSATAVARKLLGLLAERPGVDVRGLSESAATPRSTTSWNLRRLEGAGIAVRRFDDEGRERWVLAEDVPDALARIDAVRAAFRRG